MNKSPSHIKRAIMAAVTLLLIVSLVLPACFTALAEKNAQIIPGDLNDDKAVTDSDAVYLLFHTFFAEEYPVNQNCDFDKDGEVTDKDAVYLLFYTFFPEEYPLPTGENPSPGGNGEIDTPWDYN